MTALDALQTTLAGEHAALFLYGVLGAQASESEAPGLFAALRHGYDTHRGQRDQLSLTIRDLGATPQAAAPVYDPGPPLSSVADVARAARDLEERCATTYAALVANTVGDQRRWAIGALTASALGLLALGGAATAFPGLAELS